MPCEIKTIKDIDAQSGVDQSSVDKSTEKWLQRIHDKLNFLEWYAGHYHVESEEDGIRIMYEDYDEICEENN